MFKYKKSVIILVIASVLFAVFGGGKLPYFILYSVLLLVLGSFFWTRATVNHLDISQRTLKDQAYVGEEIKVKTMIYNDSFMPAPYIEINNGLIKNISGKAQPSIIISLMPFNSKSVVESFPCRYRGLFCYGPVEVDISDIFGFFSWKKEIKYEGTIAVYPKIAYLERFNIRPMQMFGTVTTKQNANEDYSSISDIRKYYPGDSFKKIHWKLSARKGSLYVKNYETSGSAEAYIFLNFFKNDFSDIYRADLEEKAVECASSIIFYMLAKNINTGLYTNGRKISYIRGRDVQEFKKFMEEFITVKSDGSIPMVELLESRARLMPKGSSIILITPSLNNRMMQKIVQLNEADFDVILVYIMQEDLKQEHKKIINHYGIKLYKVGLSDDVKTSLEG